MSGDPTARGITLWTRVRRRRGRGASSSRSRATAASAASSRAGVVATSERAATTPSRRASSASAPRAVLLPLRDRAARTVTGRALPHRAAARTPASLRFAFFSCQEYTLGYYNAHALLARRGRRLRRLPGRLHLRRDIPLRRPHRRARRPIRPQPHDDASLASYRAQVRALPLGPRPAAMHARFPMISFWDDHEVQNNYAGGRPTAGSAPGGLPPPGASRGLPRVLRADADLPLRRQPRLYHRRGSARRWTCSCSTSASTARPALRRRGRAACPELGARRATSSARASSRGPVAACAPRRRAGRSWPTRCRS